MHKAGAGQLSPGFGKESILTEGGGEELDPRVPLGGPLQGQRLRLRIWRGGNPLASLGSLEELSVDEAMGAQEAMEDSWPEGQDHPDDFGLEDLVQFFGAEGMGLG